MLIFRSCLYVLDKGPLSDVYDKYSSMILCVSVIYSLKICWVKVLFTQSNLYEVLEQVRVSCDDRNQNNLQQWRGCDWKEAGKNLLGRWAYSVSWLEWQWKGLYWKIHLKSAFYYKCRYYKCKFIINLLLKSHFIINEISITTGKTKKLGYNSDPVKKWLTSSYKDNIKILWTTVHNYLWIVNIPPPISTYTPTPHTHPLKGEFHHKTLEA